VSELTYARHCRLWAFCYQSGHLLLALEVCGTGATIAGSSDNTDTVTMQEPMANKNELAEQMADLTYELLENCQIKIERTAHKLNLTVAEFKLLRTIGDCEKVAAGELARRLGLSSSRLTRIIEGLIRKKIAKKSVSAKDHRVVEIQLTPDGTQTRDQLKFMYVTVHQEIIDLLPSDAGESVIHAMQKLRMATHEWIKE